MLRVRRPPEGGIVVARLAPPQIAWHWRTAASKHIVSGKRQVVEETDIAHEGVVRTPALVARLRCNMRNPRIPRLAKAAAKHVVLATEATVVGQELCVPRHLRRWRAHQLIVLIAEEQIIGLCAEAAHTAEGGGR